jgi:hypothetical protein
METIYFFADVRKGCNGSSEKHPEAKPGLQWSWVTFAQPNPFWNLVRQHFSAVCRSATPDSLRCRKYSG